LLLVVIISRISKTAIINLLLSHFLLLVLQAYIVSSISLHTFIFSCLLLLILMMTKISLFNNHAFKQVTIFKKALRQLRVFYSFAECKIYLLLVGETLRILLKLSKVHSLLNRQFLLDRYHQCISMYRLYNIIWLRWSSRWTKKV